MFTINGVACDSEDLLGDILMSTDKDALCTLRDQIISLQERIAQLPSQSERVVVMIDNTNLNLTIKKVDTTGQYRLCYNKLVEFLRAGRLLRQVRIYYSDFDRYAQLEEEDQRKRTEREGFYNWLRWQGFYLKACPLVERDGGVKEKGLDAAIIKDMDRICHDDRCDTMILISGDADYRDLVCDIQQLYCIRVEIAFFPEFTARSLQACASKFIDLSKVKEQLRRDRTC